MPSVLQAASFDLSRSRLFDPAFEKFVGDLGEYYDRLKKTLPADAAGAAPFVRGRGGTASKRTDPMDDD